MHGRRLNWVCSRRIARSAAGLLYKTSLDIGNADLQVYNPVTDTWTALAPYETGAQMAVSPDGTLYAYGFDTGTIDVYHPATDTWSPVLAAPPAATGENSNLEITAAGEFLYTEMYQTTLWYTAGGSYTYHSSLAYTGLGPGLALSLPLVTQDY